IRLGRLLAVLGGPDYEITYPNGDPFAYAPAVYEAEIVAGPAAPADGELSEVAWFTPAELPTLRLSRFTRALLSATGPLTPQRLAAGYREARPRSLTSGRPRAKRL